MPTEDEIKSDRVAPPRCPECGGDPANWRRPPAASLFHWRRVLPLVVLIPAVIGYVLWMRTTEGSRTLRDRSTVQETWVVPPITLEQLTTIATGVVDPALPTLPDGLLDETYDSWRYRHPGVRHLHVGFAVPPRGRGDYRRFGWPAHVYQRTIGSRYQNAMTRTDPQPYRTRPHDRRLAPRSPEEYDATVRARPRWEFVRGIIWQWIPPEANDGRYIIRGFLLAGIGPMLAMLFLAWFAGGLAAWLIHRLRRRNTPLRTRRWQTISLAGMAILIIVMTVITAETYTVHGGAGSDDLVHALPVETDITMEQVREAQQSPDAIRFIALRILQTLGDRVPGDAPRDKIYLVSGWESASRYDAGESVMTTFNGWPRIEISQDTFRRRGFGVVLPMTFEKGLNPRVQRGNLFIRKSTGDPADPVLGVAVNIAEAVSVLFAFWLLWWLTRCICLFIHRRLAKRRVKQGRCGPCGQVVVVPAG